MFMPVFRECLHSLVASFLGWFPKENLLYYFIISGSNFIQRHKSHIIMHQTMRYHFSTKYQCMYLLKVSVFGNVALCHSVNISHLFVGSYSTPPQRSNMNNSHCWPRNVKILWSFKLRKTTHQRTQHDIPQDLESLETLLWEFQISHVYFTENFYHGSKGLFFSRKQHNFYMKRLNKKI
jgi:hypothetical protein